MATPPGRDMSVYVEWDVGNWSRALDFWAERCEPGALDGADVLELGSRDGGLSLWFADHGARHVVCSDLEGPSESARLLHSQAGAGDRIEYAAIDATRMERPGSFDVVAFKSVLGGIGGAGGMEAQRRAVRGMYDCLRPGGVLLFAENLTASRAHAHLRRRFVPWSDRWRYVTEAEVGTFLAPFSDVELTTFGLVGAFGRTEGQRATLSRIDRSGFDRLAPSGWRYIIAGVATK